MYGLLSWYILLDRRNYNRSIDRDIRNYRNRSYQSTFADLAEEGTSSRTCYSSDGLRRFLIQTKRSWARRYPDLRSLADGHNLSRLVGLEAWGLGLTYNNRSCSRVQWLDSTWKLGQLRQGWGMGRRQVSSQQNVSYSTSTRRETRSHVTTDKLTVAYAAQTVSNFSANREFRTSICLGDTAGKLAGTMERISSRWIQPGTRPSLANTFYPGSYRNFNSTFASSPDSTFDLSTRVLELPWNIISIAQELFEINSDFLMNATKFAGIRESLLRSNILAWFLPTCSTRRVYRRHTWRRPSFIRVRFIYDLVCMYLRIN